MGEAVLYPGTNGWGLERPQTNAERPLLRGTSNASVQKKKRLPKLPESRSGTWFVFKTLEWGGGANPTVTSILNPSGFFDDGNEVAAQASAFAHENIEAGD
jgi:hypothetical protein